MLFRSGEFEAAVDWLRKKGLSKAAKKADRVAAEGLVAALTGDKTGVVVEVNSETDFVARNDDFQKLTRNIAAVAVGIGARALRESLAVVQRARGAGGEQTVQGLLADSATELDAARVLVWHACAEPTLALASMAKLAATTAAQQAVARATQVVGVSSFVRGHVIEQLTHDVRAIELFAGRTEALRDAVARAVLPGSQAPSV